MKKMIFYFIGLCGLGFVVLVTRWLLGYYYDGVVGLKPELLFILPVEECGTVSFTTNALNKVWLTVWPEVDEMCLSRGFQSELHHNRNSFFAVKGNKAVRFLPEVFHSVKGDIEFEPADPNMAYFYRYRARYYPIVLQP